MSEWIGVDFDGTLVIQPKGWMGLDWTGEPIMPMVEMVRRWLESGETVKIFTARVCESRRCVPAIERFCMQHFGQILEVTCIKDLDCKAIYDDKAISVEHNTGRIMTILKG